MNEDEKEDGEPTDKWFLDAKNFVSKINEAMTEL